MKLALGTVQFGLDYGINNSKGKPPKEEVAKILRFAKQRGITILDTASAYGNSQQVIGEVADKDAFNIVTKLGKENVNSMKNDFLESLKHLQTSSVYACLFHHFESFKENPNVWQEMIHLKQQGLTKKIGFSLYSPDELEYLYSHNINFDIIQIPFSIFDQRFSSYLEGLQNRGVEVHVRSVFLQGLFFKTQNNLHPHFNSIQDKIEKLHSLSTKENIPISSLCIHFALQHHNINKVVIGVDSVENLQENVEAITHADEQKIQKICAQLANLRCEDEKIILPTHWPPRS